MWAPPLDYGAHIPIWMKILSSFERQHVSAKSQQSAIGNWQKSTQHSAGKLFSVAEVVPTRMFRD
jgi:hypothetical protein